MVVVAVILILIVIVCVTKSRTKDANGFAVRGSLVMQQANVVSMHEYVRIRLDNLV